VVLGCSDYHINPSQASPLPSRHLLTLALWFHLAQRYSALSRALLLELDKPKWWRLIFTAFMIIKGKYIAN